jgi:signal transduction histidine kinase
MTAGSSTETDTILMPTIVQMTRLVSAVQELSLARNLDTIMDVVGRAGRELTGADGATFVLREGDQCHYADENAISPLWKGQRLPLSACISGWTMLNRQAAVIEDIYADPRIPADAYRPTFVKSLAIVPIRTEAPIGAIGNYWATRRQPTGEEVELLQALANTTAVAMENVRVYAELEQRVKERTAELEVCNQEFDAFSYAVSHDLRAPLRAVRGFGDLLKQHCAETLDDKGRNFLERICSSGERMGLLIEDLLRLSHVSRADLRRQALDLSELARTVTSRIAHGNSGPQVEVQIADGLKANGDFGLVTIVLENLFSNGWKYTSKCDQPRVEFASRSAPEGSTCFYVRDNGAGFDMQYAKRLFQPFQRLHSEADFPGTGIGLATVRRIIQRHGGRIWAEAEIGKGATFCFTLSANK